MGKKFLLITCFFCVFLFLLLTGCTREDSIDDNQHTGLLIELKYYPQGYAKQANTIFIFEDGFSVSISDSSDASVYSKYLHLKDKNVTIVYYDGFGLMTHKALVSITEV